jgi:hypothetical protein
MGYSRLRRPKVIEKISRDYNKAKKKLTQHHDILGDLPKNEEKLLIHQEAVIYIVHVNPESTAIEFGDAVYQVQDPWHRRYLWTRDKRLINVNDHWLLNEIIGVDYKQQVFTKGGKATWVIYTYDEMAKGQPALIMAERCQPYIDGWKEKKKRLVDMGHDGTLARRLQRQKRRLIEIVEGNHS